MRRPGCRVRPGAAATRDDKGEQPLGCIHPIGRKILKRPLAENVPQVCCRRTGHSHGVSEDGMDVVPHWVACKIIYGGEPLWFILMCWAIELSGVCWSFSLPRAERKLQVSSLKVWSSCKACGQGATSNQAKVRFSSPRRVIDIQMLNTTYCRREGEIMIPEVRREIGTETYLFFRVDTHHERATLRLDIEVLMACLGMRSEKFG